MLKVLGENYFVDLDQIEQYLDIKEVEADFSGNSESKVNIVKLEMIKMLMEVLLTENNDMDDKLGLKSKETSIPFKIAFNTLLNKKLINHY
jgi:hypothetical protein